MAQFRGTIQGRRGEASRLGDKSGLLVEAASWEGKVSVRLYHDNASGKDFAHVSLAPHHGAGTSRVLYNGPVSGEGALDIMARLSRPEE